VGALAARRARPGAAPARVPFHPAVPWLAVAAIAGILTSVTAREWAVVLGVLAAAAAGYALTGRGRRAAAACRAAPRLRPTPPPMTDPLLRFRAEFPTLERCTYLVSNSLGAMPRAARDGLAAYADEWTERGVRAWADAWWELPVRVGDAVAPSWARRPARSR
jgi:hypothetical protein